MLVRAEIVSGRARKEVYFYFSDTKEKKMNSKKEKDETVRKAIMKELRESLMGYNLATYNIIPDAAIYGMK